MNRRLQDNLETFRVNFRETRLLQEESYITYIHPNPRYINKSVTEANILIDKLNLPLVAIHTPGERFFTVQSNETEV